MQKALLIRRRCPCFGCSSLCHSLLFSHRQIPARLTIRIFFLHPTTLTKKLKPRFSHGLYTESIMRIAFFSASISDFRLAGPHPCAPWLNFFVMKMTVPLLLLTPERLSDKIHFYFSITHSRARRAFLPEIGNKTRKTTTTPCTVMYNGRLAAMIERNKCAAAYLLFTFICARSRLLSASATSVRSIDRFVSLCGSEISKPARLARSAIHARWSLSVLVVAVVAYFGSTRTHGGGLGLCSGD